MPTESYCFTDLHTHILPGVDDGAADLEQSLAMLEVARKDGTRRIVLTPHYRGSFKPEASFLRERFGELQQAASRQFPDMELYLGSEIAFFHEAAAGLKEGRLLTLNDSRYVLVEFSPDVPRTQLMYGISALIDAGYDPILAHAERYAILSPELARLLVERGCLLQLNADSVMGNLGFRTRRLCQKLLKECLVFCIASDSHSADHRPPQLRKCFTFIQKKYGTDCAHALFDRNPRSLLAKYEL